jgi:hypothetical protein
LPPRDFRTHYSFRCCAHARAFGVWTLPLPCRAAHAVRFRQGPSSLYTFPGSLMRRTKFTREQIVSAVKGATSIRQVLIRLDVAPYGGNYGVLRRALHRYNIDTSRFTGRAWSRHRQLPPRKSLVSYLENASPIQSFKLKRRLLREGLLTRIGASCGLTDWLGAPIPLELDHINGNNQDNRFANLRLLCPNCHALTPTYRSKRRTGA